MAPLQRRQAELSVQEKERALGRVETESMTAPDGTVFEREKGKPGAQWQQSIKLPAKPVEATTDQRELEQINKERSAANMPALRMDEWKIQKGRANAPAVNIDQKQETEFGKETGKALAKRFDEMATEGDAAAQNLDAVAQLRGLGDKISTGGGAVVKGMLGRMGIKTEGVSDIEAYGALIDRLTPQQRVPGSGATSDFDAKMFKGSLPNLMNTPDGNRFIVDTMEKIIQNRMARGDIAMRAQLPKDDEAYLSQSSALKEIRKLQAEARTFSDSVKEAGKAMNPGQTPAQNQTKTATPQRKSIGGKTYEQRGADWYEVQ
jgi:hypothetical protein